ncbi:MAG: prepilin-type N-terminal cleavage/methylation domain-containing protein [Lachnospiraceae bacterium]
MNKLREVRDEKKLDNKGFSLVELIIVIAIMAVLIGVLAPQYLKYVEKSRQSADLDNIDTLISAVEIYSADPANAIVDGTLTCASGTIAAPTSASDLDKALKDAGITTLPTMKSKAYADWSIKFDSTGVAVTDGNADNNPDTDLKKALGRG